MIKNKKILLTGAYGFLGSHLYGSLKEKNKVYRIGRYKKNEKISLYNLKKKNFFYDIVIHCAGGSSVSNSITNPKEDYKKTVESTKILLNYIKSHQKKIKFIFENPRKAEKVRKLGNRLVIKHSYVNRIKFLLQEINK